VYRGPRRKSTPSSCRELTPIRCRQQIMSSTGAPHNGLRTFLRKPRDKARNEPFPLARFPLTPSQSSTSQNHQRALELYPGSKSPLLFSSYTSSLASGGFCRVYPSLPAMLSMAPCSFSLPAEARRSRRGLLVLRPRRDCKLSMESVLWRGERSSGKSCSVHKGSSVIGMDWFDLSAIK
jgi:hypothetical protein